MTHFTCLAYRHDDDLYYEEVSLKDVARAVGTPFYLYSERALTEQLAAFQKTLDKTSHEICFSVKANSNLAVLDALVRRGAGLDIVSGGELARARRVNCPPQRLVYSGVGKTEREIRAALEYGLLLFNVESADELRRIHAVAGEMGLQAPVALRINPAIDPETHPYIATGLKQSKFGIPHGEARKLYRLANSLSHLEVRGIACHVGSQITTLAPFIQAIRRLKTLLAELREDGIVIQYLDIGGGLGIVYDPANQSQEKQPPSPEVYLNALLQEVDDLEITLIIEPGRAIAGNAGVLVTRAEYLKENEEKTKTFVITDAGMNDLLRPALYDARHHVLPVRRRPNVSQKKVDLVGPICESGDFLARGCLLPELSGGDLLALCSAGAYGFVMSSSYNSRPRIPEILVCKDRYAVVRRRETVEELFATEVFPPWREREEILT